MMTEALQLRFAPWRTADNRLVSGVCFAHFISHYYITLLAPLFIFVRDDFGVSYTELGLALTAFNVVSTLLQTPTGFLVDRFSPRQLLMAGLLLGAAAFATAALVQSFWVFVAMFGVAGIGNTVYHPADYSLLSQHIPAERAGRVFSFHTFSGMAGNAAAPPTLLLMHSMVGWRGAFLGAAALGVIGAFAMLLLREPQPIRSRLHRNENPEAKLSGWRLLVSAPILLNLLFFILLSFCTGGLNQYLVAALGALNGTPPAVASTALAALLTMSAVGVLIGGTLTGYTSRHGLVAATGLAVTALSCTLLGLVNFNSAALVMLMSGAGLFSGLAMPSRDMIVRSVAPAGAYGRVFGFVSTGFNIAGIVSPLIFGQLLDHGHVRAMFFFMGGCALLAIATVVISTSARRPA
ncbi:MAG TPA: MFS transporter [Xanthobacteraceae bacterium]|jgi:MFS family permease